MEFVSLICNWIFWGSFRHIVLQFLVRSITEGFAMAIKDVFAVNSIFLSICSMNLKQIIAAWKKISEKKSAKYVIVMWCRESLKLFYLYLIPKFDIESKIDMEVLMMIVVENAIWLPRLPPVLFESDARMINDSMVIRIDHHGRKRNCKTKYVLLKYNEFGILTYSNELWIRTWEK